MTLLPFINSTLRDVLGCMLTDGLFRQAVGRGVTVIITPLAGTVEPRCVFLPDGSNNGAIDNVHPSTLLSLESLLGTFVRDGDHA